VSQIETQTCALRMIAEGRSEACSRDRCSFWEPGGAVIEGRCLIERLGSDIPRPELAAYLIEVRGR
jgi:hypothetical protein